MGRVLITGSSEGLGLMAGQLLADQGHEVVLHARNESRAHDARSALPSAAGVLIGDLSTLEGMRRVATGANADGPFDAVIHNVGVGHRQPERTLTVDGLCLMFVVNVVAPYLLTSLIDMPRRLVYLSSGMHGRGNPSLDDPQWERRPWSGTQAYSDSKLFDLILAFAVARLRPDVWSNAVEPGWVATKMGGPSASDDLGQGAVTQAWLAVSDDPDAAVSGRYFYHRHQRQAHPAAYDPQVQDELLDTCAAITGTVLPRHEGAPVRPAGG